jgi:hypothetical protein
VAPFLLPRRDAAVANCRPRLNHPRATLCGPSEPGSLLAHNPNRALKHHESKAGSEPHGGSRGG